MSITLNQDDFDRVADAEIARILRGIHDSQQALLTRFDRMDERVVQAEADVVDLKRAFPNGDTEGHRRYHDTMIVMIEEKRRLRIAVQEKTISGLVWATLVFLGMAMWNQFMKWVH